MDEETTRSSNSLALLLHPTEVSGRGMWTQQHGRTLLSEHRLHQPAFGSTDRVRSLTICKLKIPPPEIPLPLSPPPRRSAYREVLLPVHQFSDEFTPSRRRQLPVVLQLRRRASRLSRVLPAPAPSRRRRRRNGSPTSSPTSSPSSSPALSATSSPTDNV